MNLNHTAHGTRRDRRGWHIRTHRQDQPIFINLLPENRDHAVTWFGGWRNRVIKRWKRCSQRKTLVLRRSRAPQALCTLRPCMLARTAQTFGADMMCDVSELWGLMSCRLPAFRSAEYWSTLYTADSYLTCTGYYQIVSKRKQEPNWPNTIQTVLNYLWPDPNLTRRLNRYAFVS